MDWLQQQHAIAPDKPFFAYYAPGATHGPHHVFKEWIDKFKGKFDRAGTSCARSLRAAEEARRDSAGHHADAAPGQPAGLGLARREAQGALFHMAEIYAGFLAMTTTTSAA